MAACHFSARSFIDPKKYRILGTVVQRMPAEELVPQFAGRGVVLGVVFLLAHQVFGVDNLLLHALQSWCVGCLIR